MKTDAAPQEYSAQLRRTASKLCWWQSADDTLRQPIRFAAQLMTFGSWDDIVIAREELGDELFKETLRHPPPGVFDARSWNYWHLVFKITPAPTLPQRRFS